MTVIRLPEVLRRIGVSRSKLYADIKNGAFPHPISLGARAVGWLDTEVDDWIAVRAEAAHRCRSHAAFAAVAQ